MVFCCMAHGQPILCIWTCMGKCGENTPDSKVHGANMGPIWGREDPGGPHVSPMNYAIWDYKKQQAI